MPSSSGGPALAHGDDAELLVRDRPGDQVDGELAVARLEDVQRQRRPRHQHRAQREQRKGLGHRVTVRRPARRCSPGGRSTANASVTRSARSVNRNSAAGRPPAGPGWRDRRRSVPAAPRRVSTRCRFVADTGCPSAADVELAQRGDGELARGQREPEVGVGELGAQPVAGRRDDHGVVERRRRERRRRGCHAVSPGTRRVGVGGHQAEERGGDHPRARHPVRARRTPRAARRG